MGRLAQASVGLGARHRGTLGKQFALRARPQRKGVVAFARLELRVRPVSGLGSATFVFGATLGGLDRGTIGLRSCSGTFRGLLLRARQRLGHLRCVELESGALFGLRAGGVFRLGAGALNARRLLVGGGASACGLGELPLRFGVLD